MKHLSFIHLFQLFLSMYCGYWWYCVFSPKCLPVVNLWQFSTWSKQYDGSNREALWTCTSHFTSHPKHQLLVHTILKVLFALKPLTCVYVPSFLPEPLLLEWTSNRRRWELLGSAGNVELEDVSGWRRTANVQGYGLHPLSMGPQDRWWCPLEAWWLFLRQSLSLCTLGSHHNGSPVLNAMAFPICLCIGFTSVWNASPAIPFSLQPQWSCCLTGKLPLGLSHPPFTLLKPPASLRRLRESTSPNIQKTQKARSFSTAFLFI